MGLRGNTSIITFEPTGMGSQKNTYDEIIKEKLRYFLNVNEGDIPANPSYGADLIHFVHLPYDQSLVESVDSQIRAKLSLFFPMIDVDGLESNYDKDTGVGSFTLFYEVNGNEDSVDFNLNFIV